MPYSVYTHLLIYVVLNLCRFARKMHELLGTGMKTAMLFLVSYQLQPYRVIFVPDHGRPSISGPIRSIKMYSWAQCTVQKRLVCSGDIPCVAQEEQGFGPSTLSTYPLPIYLG